VRLISTLVAACSSASGTQQYLRQNWHLTPAREELITIVRRSPPQSGRLKIHAHLMAWTIIGELAGRCHRFADHSPRPFKRWSRCWTAVETPVL